MSGLLAWVDRVFVLASCIASIPALIVVLQVGVAALLRRNIEPLASGHENRLDGFVVLMPAHDEADGIVPPVRAVLAQCGPLDRLLVVADNCQDETAIVARAAGAEVIERNDVARRGKGYALDFGIKWLERGEKPPSVVVIVDADCIVAPSALERLARACLSSNRPVQGLYLMHAPNGAGLGTRIAEFAWVVKNKLRPLGSAALGWPCQLMGTGMAFPWVAIKQAELASGHLVEDMQLGLDLARRGFWPLFVPNALISSSFPVAREAMATQRARWEHGHLSVIAGVAPRMLWQALLARDSRLAGMVLDVSVPPLAALILALIALLLIDAGWWLVSGNGAATGVTFASLVMIGVAVIVAWRLEGQRIIDARELLRLPLYAFAKIPIYIRVFTKRQVEWVRTKRDERHHR